MSFRIDFLYIKKKILIYLEVHFCTILSKLALILMKVVESFNFSETSSIHFFFSEKKNI